MTFDCAIYYIFLSKMKFQCIYVCVIQDDNFIMTFEHLRNGQNELVLHVDRDMPSQVSNTVSDICCVSVCYCL